MVSSMKGSLVRPAALLLKVSSLKIESQVRKSGPFQINVIFSHAVKVAKAKKKETLFGLTVFTTW